MTWHEVDPELGATFDELIASVEQAAEEARARADMLVERAGRRAAFERDLQRIRALPELA